MSVQEKTEPGIDKQKINSKNLAEREKPQQKINELQEKTLQVIKPSMIPVVMSFRN
ncbi:hypothetical protein V5K95_003043 [Salmonella enterica]